MHSLPPRHQHETLAMAIARCQRDALEDVHAGSAWMRSGLSDPVMQFLNRRAARYAFENLATMSDEEFCAICDWDGWVAGMWSYSVLETDLASRIHISPTRLRTIRRAIKHQLRCVRATYELSLKKDVAFEHYAVPMNLMPAGWDRPSIAVPAQFFTKAP